MRKRKGITDHRLSTDVPVVVCFIGRAGGKMGMVITARFGNP